MAVQLNTESLTKSHQFIWEACKILWQHKKVFFAFAALPMVLDVVGFAAIKFTEMQYILSLEEKRKAEFSKDLIFYQQQGVDASYRIEPSPEQHREYIEREYLRGERHINPIFIRITLIFIFLKSMVGLFFMIAWFQYLLNPLYKASIRNYFTTDERFFKFLGILICYCSYMVLGFVFVRIMLLIPKSEELWIIFRDPARIALKIAFEAVGFLYIMTAAYVYKFPIICVLMWIGFIGGISIIYVQLSKLPSIALNVPTLQPQNKKGGAAPRGRLFWGVLLLSLIATFLSTVGTSFLNFENVGLSIWSNIKYALSIMGISMISSALFFIMVGIILNIITLYHKKYTAETQ